MHSSEDTTQRSCLIGLLSDERIVLEEMLDVKHWVIIRLALPGLRLGLARHFAKFGAYTLPRSAGARLFGGEPRLRLVPSCPSRQPTPNPRTNGSGAYICRKYMPPLRYSCRIIYNSIRRNEFTAQHDSFLVQYIATYCPDKKNRRGNVLYETLHNNVRYTHLNGSAML